MVPFWIPIIIRHLIFRVPNLKRDHNFDNHPYGNHSHRPFTRGYGACQDPKTPMNGVIPSSKLSLKARYSGSFKFRV